MFILNRQAHSLCKILNFTNRLMELTFQRVHGPKGKKFLEEVHPFLKNGFGSKFPHGGGLVCNGMEVFGRHRFLKLWSTGWHGRRQYNASQMRPNVLILPRNLGVTSPSYVLDLDLAYRTRTGRWPSNQHCVERKAVLGVGQGWEVLSRTRKCWKKWVVQKQAASDHRPTGPYILL